MNERLQSAQRPVLPSAADGEALGIDLGELVRRCVRSWPIVLAVPLVLVALAHAAVQFLPVQYRASAQVLIFDPLRSATTALARNVAPVRDLDPVTINTEVEVIKSDSALEQLARSLRLDEVPEFQDRGRIAWLRKQLGLDDPQENWRTAAAAGNAGSSSAALGSAVVNLRKRIAVDRVPLSYVVTVSATAGSPELAYKLVTGLVRVYLDGQDVLSQRSLDRSATWLRSKVAEVQARASETNRAIERLRADSGLGRDGTATLAQQQRADISAKLASLRAEIAEQEVRLRLARRAMGENDAGQAMPDWISSPALNQLRLQLSVLLRGAAQLRDRFGPRHAQVVAAEERILTLRRAISDEVRRVVSEQEANYELAQHREQALAANLDRLRSVQADAGVLARLQELQHAAEADARLLESYSSRLESVEAARSLRTSGKRILSPGSVPDAPSAPHKLLITAGAGVFGLALGLGLAVLLALLRHDVPPALPGQRRFGEPVIGNVPLLKRRQGWRAAAHRATDGDSAIAEAMHAVRVGLQLGSRGGSPKVIVVTSARRGEGRSTVAAALAVAIAQDGQPTVLVDCDLASPAVSVPPRWEYPGIAEALSSELDAATLARRDPDLGCYIIPAGDRRVTGSRALLTSTRFKEIVTRLRKAFVFVVIDAPPLLPIPEACGMAEVADAVLLVVDAGRTRTGNLIQVAAVLGSVGPRFAGIVLNKQPLERLRRMGLVSPARTADWRGKSPSPWRDERSRRATSSVAIPRTYAGVMGVGSSDERPPQGVQGSGCD